MGGAISQCTHSVCSYCLDAHNAGIETGDEIDIISKPGEPSSLPNYLKPVISFPIIQTKLDFIQPKETREKQPSDDSNNNNEEDFDVSSGSDTEERVEFEAPTSSSLTHSHRKVST